MIPQQVVVLSIRFFLKVITLLLIIFFRLMLNIPVTVTRQSKYNNYPTCILPIYTGIYFI